MTLLKSGLLLGLLTVLSLVDARSLRTPDHKSFGDVELKYRYGAVVDAGSSGSRIYLYQWVCTDNSNHDLSLASNLQITGDTLPDIEPMIDQTTGKFLKKKIEPGLSEQSPEGAFDYMKQLLDYAGEKIPSEGHNVTSLYILGTAGMRLLPDETEEAIYKALREGIRKNYQYDFEDDDIETIDGQEEALYRWVALNFALGNVQDPAGRTTDASAELGGASMQLAFEMNVEEMEILRRSESVGGAPSIEANVTLGDRTYQMYLASWLGYGANTAFARDNTAEVLLSGGKVATQDPCYHHGFTEDMAVDIDTSRITDEEMKTEFEGYNGEATIEGLGEWEKCYMTTDNFTLHEMSFYKRCFDNNTCAYDAFEINDEHLKLMEGKTFYSFASFWHATDPIFNMGGELDLSKYEAAAKEFCSLDWDAVKSDNADIPEKYLKQKCWITTYIVGIFRDGFHLDKASKIITTEDVVNGKDARWTLGALVTRYDYESRTTPSIVSGTTTPSTSKTTATSDSSALSPALYLAGLAMWIRLMFHL